MRESCKYGSARGASRKGGPYRNRREFIAGLGGAVAWPMLARAQQAEPMRRIGVLMSSDENDPNGKRAYSGFTQALANLGWTEGRNVRMDVRSGHGDTNRIQVLAKELVGLQPDIIVVSSSTAGTVAVQRETRTMPARGGAADAAAAASGV